MEGLGGAGAAAGAGAALGGSALAAGAAAGPVPPVAPTSMEQSFCPALTVSPSLVKISLMTPETGAGTGTEVCEG